MLLIDHYGNAVLLMGLNLAPLFGDLLTETQRLTKHLAGRSFLSPCLFLMCLFVWGTGLLIHVKTSQQFESKTTEGLNLCDCEVKIFFSSPSCGHIKHDIVWGLYKWLYKLFLSAQINAQLDGESPWLLVHPIWTIKIYFSGPLHHHQGALDSSSMQCCVWQIATEVTHVFSKGIREYDRVYNQPPTHPSFSMCIICYLSQQLQGKGSFNNITPGP